jgi:cytidylate kinase
LRIHFALVLEATILSLAIVRIPRIEEKIGKFFQRLCAKITGRNYSEDTRFTTEYTVMIYLVYLGKNTCLWK